MFTKIEHFISVLIGWLTFMITYPITLIIMLLNKIFNAVEAAWMGFLCRKLINLELTLGDESAMGSIKTLMKINEMRYNKRKEIFNKIAGL